MIDREGGGLLVLKKKKKIQWMTAVVSIGVFWKWTFLGGFEREGVGGEGAFVGHFW